jgi:crotonyl-CoA reductase
VKDILDAILAGESAPEAYAALGVPDSYRAVTVHKDEVALFDGREHRDKDPRESLHVDEVAVPELGPGEALVAVMASAVNYNTVWTSIFEPVSTFGFLERYGRTSTYAKRHDLPYHVVGSDAAGVVLRVGPGVTRWAPGDEVVAHCLSVELEDPQGHDDTMLDPQQRIWGFETNFGGLAEVALVKANQLMPKPAHLTWEEAACPGLVNSTAYRQLVSRNGAAMKQGDVVLIWGASGGLGSYATQYALNGGAVPRLRREQPGEGRDRRRMGAELVIDRSAEGYRFWKDEHQQDPKEWQRFGKRIRELTGGDDIDIVFEHPAGDLRRVGLRDKKGGVITPCASDERLHAHLRQPLPLDELKRSSARTSPTTERAGRPTAHQPRLVHPTLSRTYPLEETGQAAYDVHRNLHQGKVGVLCLAPRRGWAYAIRRCASGISPRSTGSATSDRHPSGRCSSGPTPSSSVSGRLLSATIGLMDGEGTPPDAGATRPPGTLAPMDVASVSEQAARLLYSAQRHADRLVSETQQTAGRVRHEAELLHREAAELHAYADRLHREAAELHAKAEKRHADALEQAASVTERARVEARARLEAAADEAHQLLADAADQAGLVVAAANTTADELVARAEREAADVQDNIAVEVSATRSHLDDLRAAAREEADRIVGEAREDAHRRRLEGDAEARARVETAKVDAARLRDEAEGRVGEIIAAAERRAAALRAEAARELETAQGEAAAARRAASADAQRISAEARAEADGVLAGAAEQTPGRSRPSMRSWALRPPRPSAPGPTPTPRPRRSSARCGRRPPVCSAVPRRRLPPASRRPTAARPPCARRPRVCSSEPRRGRAPDRRGQRTGQRVRSPRRPTARATSRIVRPGGSARPSRCPGAAERIAEQVSVTQREAQDQRREARTEATRLVAEARRDADVLRTEAHRLLEEARAEVAELTRRRDSIAAELGQLSGVIEALAVPVAGGQREPRGPGAGADDRGGTGDEPPSGTPGATAPPGHQVQPAPPGHQVQPAPPGHQVQPAPRPTRPPALQPAVAPADHRPTHPAHPPHRAPNRPHRRAGRHRRAPPRGSGRAKMTRSPARPRTAAT